MTALSVLTSPSTPEKFLSLVSDRKSFFIQGGTDKFRNIFSIEKFHAAISTGESESPSGFRLSRFVEWEDDETAPPMRSEVIPVKEVSAAMRNGNTICVTHIELCDPGLAEWVNEIKHELNYLGDVQVNCYYSSEGSGAKMHFDTRPGIILQIAGNKLWNYGKEPVVEWPLSNAQVNRKGDPVWVSPLAGFERWEKTEPVKEKELDEIILNPGDLLYLPAGTWHSAKGIGYSLALNIAFRPYDYFTLLMKLMYDQFEPDGEWRGGAIPFTGGLLEEINSPVAAHWHQRLNDLKDYFCELKANPELLADLYASLR